MDLLSEEAFLRKVFHIEEEHKQDAKSPTITADNAATLPLSTESLRPIPSSDSTLIPPSINLDTVSYLLTHRMTQPHVVPYLMSSWLRLYDMSSQHPLFTPISHLILHHMRTLLLQPHLFKIHNNDGTQQLYTYLINKSKNSSTNETSTLTSFPPSLTSFFTSLIHDTPYQQRMILIDHIFTPLLKDAGRVTLLSTNYSAPLHLLSLLLSIPSLCEYWCLAPDFISPWLNGWRVEMESPMGVLLRITPLPDEPSVGERYFSRRLIDTERNSIMNKIYDQLDHIHMYARIAWEYMLQHTITREALLTWIATMLLANWGRTRMHTQKRSNSNDGFLLNTSAIMLRLAFTHGWFNDQNLDSVDPLYAILPSRLELKEETKIAATPADEAAWLRQHQQQQQQQTITKQDDIKHDTDIEMHDEKDEKEHKTINGRFKRARLRSSPSSSPPPPSTSPSQEPSSFTLGISPTIISPPEADAEYLSRSFTSIHHGIVCDKCRTKDFHGVRYKCANCRDYDLCGVCESQDYVASLGLADRLGVTFICPYASCGVAGLDEIGLRDHVRDVHTDDTTLISCPICIVNGWAQSLFIQPRFNTHLAQDHCCEHDSVKHVMVKIPHTLPHFHGRLFNAIPNLDVDLARPEPIPTDISPPTGFLTSTAPLSLLLQSRATAEHQRATQLYQHQQQQQAQIQMTVPLTSLAQMMAGTMSIRTLFDAAASGGIQMQPRRASQPNTSTPTTAPTPPAPIPPLSVASADRRQMEVIHKDVTCSHCGIIPHGILYKCYNCADYQLCQMCESLGFSHHHHTPAHVFLKLRRPLNTPLNTITAPPLYPAAMLGSGGFNLVTEWFFLVMHNVHVGLIKTCSRYSSLISSLASDSLARNNESLIKIKLCVDAQLLHPSLLQDTLSLYVWTAKWITHIIDPHGKGLPLATQIPMEFGALPEYFIDDMSDFIIFMARFSMTQLENTNITPILHLFVTLIASQSYINNPYLRAKLVEVFCSIASFPTVHGPGSVKLSAILGSDTFIINHLMPALVSLYVDIETTGSDSQFYDKFNVRHAISVLMQHLGENSSHLQVLERASEQDSNFDLFRSFVNAIINDMIYLLDECFMKATSLQQLQAIQTVTLNTNVKRQEHASNLDTTMKALRTASVLATHTVNLLALLCRNPILGKLLLRAEMLERLTQCVNQYVSKLAGSKRSTILVSDPSSTLNYKPDTWLHTFTSIYVSYGSNETFMQAVVKDGRCFSVPDFQNAEKILKEKGLIPETDTTLASFITSAEEYQKKEYEELEELGEIPEEFLDPILNTIMEDPVRLPSGVAMDRPVIERHLLNKRMDPFNRQPLEIADLVPDPELRERIQQFKREAKQRNTNKSNETRMETDTTSTETSSQPDTTSVSSSSSTSSHSTTNHTSIHNPSADDVD